VSANQSRLTPRSAVRERLEVRYLHARSVPGGNVAVCTLDLSPTGIRLVVRTPLTPGDSVEVTLPSEDLPLKVRGRVTWSAPLPDGCTCVGVHFDAPLPPATVAHLALGAPTAS
jgi:hypothetical protein